jgi:hypothetical protein
MKLSIQYLAILVFFLFLGGGGERLFAQETSETNIPHRFHLSIYTGFNFTNFSGKTDQYATVYGNEVGISLKANGRSFLMPIGIYASYYAFPWLSFKAGILNSPKGIRFHGSTFIQGDIYTPGSGYNLHLNVTHKLHYLQFPVIMKLIPTREWNSKKIHFYFDLGIVPSFLTSSKLNARAWTSYFLSSSDPTEETRDFDDFNQFDLGYVIGCGFKIGNFHTGLFFEKGLKQVADDYWDFKNQNIAFVLEYYFSLNFKRN